jgi:uncharacterized protein
MNITLKPRIASNRLTQSRAFNARTYVPDLSAFMSLCDANYVKFMKLLPRFNEPNMDKSDTRVFGLSRNKHELGLIIMEIIERSRYTTTIAIQQGADVNLLPETRMQVRLYHDASMAEVLSYQGIGQLRANYVYPNKHMYQKDEKILCNEFLADWLSYCLKFGYSLGEYVLNKHDFSEDAAEHFKKVSIEEDNHK